MGKRLQVLLAVKAVLATAVPAAEVLGLDPADRKPDLLPDGGLVWLDYGDPGPPQIDLSPPVYHWDHDIPVELAFRPPPGVSALAFLDTLLAPIGAAIAADPTLGGLCDWLEPSAPTGGQIDERGAEPIVWANFTLTASYETTGPLG